MSWHLEILSDNQRRVLAELGPLLTGQGFYLAGGTALALHFGHRRAVDLDWFTARSRVRELAGQARAEW